MVHLKVSFVLLNVAVILAVPHAKHHKHHHEKENTPKTLEERIMTGPTDMSSFASMPSSYAGTFNSGISNGGFVPGASIWQQWINMVNGGGLGSSPMGINPLASGTSSFGPNALSSGINTFGSGQTSGFTNGQGSVPDLSSFGSKY